MAGLGDDLVELFVRRVPLAECALHRSCALRLGLGNSGRSFYGSGRFPCVIVLFGLAWRMEGVLGTDIKYRYIFWGSPLWAMDFNEVSRARKWACNNPVIHHPTLQNNTELA